MINITPIVFNDYWFKLNAQSFFTWCPYDVFLTDLLRTITDSILPVYFDRLVLRTSSISLFITITSLKHRLLRIQ